MAKTSVKKKEQSAFWDKLFYRQKAIDLSDAHDGSNIKYVRKKRPIALLSSLLVVVGLIVASFLVMSVNNLDFSWQRLGEILSGLFSPYGGPYFTRGGYNADPETCSATATYIVSNGVVYGTCEGYVFGWEGWWLFMAREVLPSLWQTIEMCFIATVIGGLISIPIYYLSARNISKKAYVYEPVRVINDLLRTIPTLILAILATLIFGYNFISGIVALIFFTLGIIYKLMYEYIETIDMNPSEATRSAGASLLQDITTTIHPTTKPMFFANLLYVFEMNIRGSVVLGYIGCGGIGYLIQQYIAKVEYDKIGAILVPLFLVVFVLQLLSNFIARKLR